MQMRIQVKIRVIIILVLAATMVNIVSSFSLLNINGIVHGDLYRFGLQFSFEWADPYWMNFQFALSSVVLASVLTGISVFLVLLYSRNRSKTVVSFISVALVLAFAASLLALYFTSVVDRIINVDLYYYGLRFDPEWAIPYWMSLRAFLGLQLFSIIVVAGSAGWSFLTPMKAPSRLSKLTSPALLGAGGICFVFSLIYGSSAAALIGLGLIFWGVVIRYAAERPYVRKEFMDLSMASAYGALAQSLSKFGSKTRAVFLPAEYLDKIDSNLVFVTEDPQVKLPSPEKVSQGKAPTKREKAVLLVPPGHGLTRLLEKTINKSFTKVNLEFLIQRFRKIVVEDLEIAGDFTIAVEGNNVRVVISDSIFSNSDFWEERYSRVLSLLGSPIGSAVACILAKVVAKPVVISEHEIIEDQNVIRVNYELLGEEELQA